MMLGRTIQALNEANASCASAAAINFKIAKDAAPFKIRQATISEWESLKPVKDSHPALVEGAKLKTILSALAGILEAGSSKDDVQALNAIEAEADAINGEIAESKAQLQEVALAQRCHMLCSFDHTVCLCRIFAARLCDVC